MSDAGVIIAMNTAVSVATGTGGYGPGGGGDGEDWILFALVGVMIAVAAAFGALIFFNP